MAFASPASFRLQGDGGGHGNTSDETRVPSAGAEWAQRGVYLGGQ